MVTKCLVTLSCCCLISCSLPSHSLFVCLSLFGLYISHCLSSQSCSSVIGGGGQLTCMWAGSSSGASFFFSVWRAQASADACSVKLCPLGRFRKKISQGCSGAKVRSGAMAKQLNIFHKFHFTLHSLSLFFKTTLLTMSDRQYQNELLSIRTTSY